MSEQSFAPQEPNKIPTSPPEDFKESLIGEGKKYQNEDEAIKALFHSQQHIAKLEAEAKVNTAAQAEQKTMEDILAAIDARKQEQPQTPPVEGFTPPVEPTAPESAPKEEDFEELIRKVVSEDQSKRQQEANFSKAVEALDSKFGSREATNTAVEKAANEMGVSVDFLKDAARKSPAAFLKLMDSQNSSKPKPVSPVTPDVNTASLLKHAPSGPAQPGTYRWYQALRKESPAKYRQMYNQQMSDMAANPDKFYERA